MFFVKILLTSLVINNFANCEENRALVDLYDNLPTSPDSIKAFCESKTKEDLDYFDDQYFYYFRENSNMDAKSSCYCLMHFKNYDKRKNFQSVLDLHLTTFDLKCPLVFPVKRNLNYYWIKKNLLRNLSLSYLDDNYVTEMCIQNKKIKNSTNNNLNEIEMFCDLYQFYEYKTKHIYNVQYFDLTFLTLSNITFEVKNIFEQNSWTAFLNKK